MHRTLILGVYGGFIHEAWGQTRSFEWTIGFSTTVTSVFGVLCFRFQDFCVVLFYYSTHVVHAAVTNFARVSIEDCMECVALWKILVDKMDELLADVALDRLAKRGVEPNDLSLSVSLFLRRPLFGLAEH